MPRPKSIAESNIIIILGNAMHNLWAAIKCICSGQIAWDQVRTHMVFMGYECLPMILILTALASMVLSLNTSTELYNYGGRDLIGALVSVSNLREILPLFIAFAIAARSGTAMTAEIATMKVTEQIDALKLMKACPIYFLLAPRLVAGALLTPFLVAITTITSIYAGMLVSNAVVDLEFSEFLISAWQQINLKEYFYPVLKTFVFVSYAILINVSMGLACEGGAKEVGLSTTKATALAMIGIIILDGILTPLLYL